MTRKRRKPAAHAAVLEAALKIAQEHATIIEAANRNIENEAASNPTPTTAVSPR